MQELKLFFHLPAAFAEPQMQTQLEALPKTESAFQLV
jgi:hypothetical protein